MIEFGELTGRLLNYRMAIARDVIPTSEQTFNALTSLRSEEGVELPPPPLVTVETIRVEVIEPKFREVAARLGEAIGDARSTEDVPQEALSDFVLNHDYWYGALVALSPIATGLEYSRGESPEMIRKVLQNWSDYSGRDLPEPEAADIYVAQLGRFSRFAEVMGRDQTGFSLIDQIIDEMRNPDQPQLYGANRNFRREQRFTVTDMVLAGTEFSAKLYKAIYPLAE